MSFIGNRAGAWSLVVLLAACGERGPAAPNDEPDDPGNGPVEQGIVGTWDIVSVNGAAVAFGSLRWVFTETAYSAITNVCTETGTYTYAADTLRATTTGLTGDGCSGLVGATAEYEVTVEENTLTAAIPDLEGGEASTFVFVRF